jgi:hypothetical protein
MVDMSHQTEIFDIHCDSSVDEALLILNSLIVYFTLWMHYIDGKTQASPFRPIVMQQHAATVKPPKSIHFRF